MGQPVFLSPSYPPPPLTRQSSRKWLPPPRSERLGTHVAITLRVKSFCEKCLMLCFQFFQWPLLKQTEHQSPRRAQPKVSVREALPLWICIQDMHTDPLCSLPLTSSSSPPQRKDQYDDFSVPTKLRRVEILHHRRMRHPIKRLIHHSTLIGLEK